MKTAILGTVVSVLAALAAAGSAYADEKPILIGLIAGTTGAYGSTGVAVVNGAQLAVDKINAAGGVMGRQLEMVVADETENPEQGISAVRKLTTDERVDVLIGGYASGVVLAEMPHAAQSETIYLGVGAASPSITAKVKSDYPNFKYFFRVSPVNSTHLAEGLVAFVSGNVAANLKYTRVAIVGENAKWAQEIVPILESVY